MNLIVFERNGQIFYRMSLNFSFSDVFSHDEMGIMGFEEEYY